LNAFITEANLEIRPLVESKKYPVLEEMAVLHKQTVVFVVYSGS
jgi:hypothetical protein